MTMMPRIFRKSRFFRSVSASIALVFTLTVSNVLYVAPSVFAQGGKTPKAERVTTVPNGTAADTAGKAKPSKRAAVADSAVTEVVAGEAVATPSKTAKTTRAAAPAPKQKRTARAPSITKQSVVKRSTPSTVRAACETKTGRGVTPTYHTGNVNTCQDIDPSCTCLSRKIPASGSWSGSGENGTYSLGAGMSITISASSMKSFNLSSTGITIYGVAVKGGDGYNLFDYRAAGGVSYDTVLFSPLNGGGQQADISHIVVCYKTDPAGLQIKKFEDTNGDGVQQAGEPLLTSPSFTFTITGPSGTLTKSTSAGIAAFSGLIAGDYTVSEAAAPGWVLTTDLSKPVATTPCGCTAVLVGNQRAKVDLSIVKTASLLNAVPGDEVVYTLLVKNKGNAPFTGATVTDDYDETAIDILDAPGATADAGVLSWGPLPTIAPGATYPINFTVKVKDPFKAAGSTVVPNTATVFAQGDVYLADNTSNKDFTVVAEPKLEIDKWADVETAMPGDQVLYTLKYTNVGHAPATDVMVRDAYDLTYVAGISGAMPAPDMAPMYPMTWSIPGTLGVGQSGYITYRATLVPWINAPATDVVNFASVLLGDEPQDSAREVVVVNAAPNLALTKDVSTSTAEPGNLLTYTVTVSNPGPLTVTGFSVSDDYDEAHVDIVDAAGGVVSGGHIVWDFPADTLQPVAAGGTNSKTITYTAKVKDPFPASGVTPVVNTATVTTAGDSDSSDNSDSATVSVSAEPKLDITKTPSATMVDQGGSLSYALAIRNLGNSPAASAYVVDTLSPYIASVSNISDGGVQIGNTIIWTLSGPFAPSAAPFATLTYDVTLVPAVPGGTVVHNVATVARSADTPPEDTDSADVTVADYVDLGLTKGVTSPTAVPGDELGYTVTVTNNSNVPVTGFTVTDVFDASALDITDPAGGVVVGDTITWTLADTTIPVGGSHTITYTAVVKNPFPVAGVTPVNNTATVSTERDADETNNSDSATVTVTGQARLDITKTPSVTTVDQGGMVTYTLQIRNVGTAPAAVAYVVDTLSSYVGSVSDISNGGMQVGNTIVWTLNGPFAADAETPFATLTYTVQLISPIAGGTVVPNTATVSRDTEGEPDDSADASVTVNSIVDLGLDKTVSVTDAIAGEEVTYTVTITNHGNAPVAGFTVSDDFDERYMQISDAAGGTVADGVVTWNVPDTLYPVGSEGPNSYTITYKATVGFDLPEGTTVIPNTARVTAQGDSNPANDADSAQISVLFSGFSTPDLAITKQSNVETAAPGDTVTYTLKYSNVGKGAAVDFTITDNYDQRYVKVTDASGATDNGDTLVWHIGTPLYAGESRTITYKVKVASDMPQGSTNVDNTVVIAHPDDANGANNTATERVIVKAPAVAPFLPFTGGDLSLLLSAALIFAAAGLALRRLAAAA